jgi:hypothetical protein
MTPRPIYRWKSFWLGVLVLGFLGWAWVRSMDHRDAFDFGVGADMWQIDSNFGTISASRHAQLGPGRGIDFLGFTSEPGGGYMREFPRAFEHVTLENFPRSKWWTVADWFVILLFLVPWVLFLAWRWWRMKRLTGKTTP